LRTALIWSRIRTAFGQSMAADSDDCAAIELTPTRTEAIDWLCACLAADDGPPTRSTWALQSQ